MLDRPVHPAAAVFPMLPEDELRELAEDIKANGLRHPIVLGPDGEIRDGRNRFVACGIAGVEPEYVTHDGDPLALILSENIRRRHLTKGQQAMAVALMIETENGRRNGQAKSLILESNISQPHVAQAVTIRRHAADLAPGVLVGTEKFETAYQVARARKQQAEDEREKKEREANQSSIELERLRRVAPDIAARVPDTMTVDEAKAAYEQRKQRERDRKEATTRLAESAFSFLDPGVAATSDERAAQIAATLDASVIPTRPDLSSARAYRCLETFEALYALIREKEERDGRSTTA